MRVGLVAVVGGGLLAALLAGDRGAPAQAAPDEPQPGAPQPPAVGGAHAERQQQIQVPPFSFQLPDGWRDLSRNAPAENFRGLPPEAVLAARHANADVDAFAAVVDDADKDNNTAFLTVETYECPGRFTEDALAALMSAQGSSGGQDLQLLDAKLVKIGGVTAARLVLGTVASGGTRVRGLQYHLPSGGTCAALTYITEEPAFERNLPTFEAAARATTGLQETRLAPTD
jgi:hypothetical protein